MQPTPLTGRHVDARTPGQLSSSSVFIALLTFWTKLAELYIQQGRQYVYDQTSLFSGGGVTCQLPPYSRINQMRGAPNICAYVTNHQSSERNENFMTGFSSAGRSGGWSPALCFLSAAIAPVEGSPLTTCRSAWSTPRSPTTRQEADTRALPPR